MKKSKKIIKWVLITGTSFALSCALAFFLAVGCGAFGSMQSIWVGSAMTTFHHKYLAEWFVPEDKINELQGGNTQDINKPVESNKDKYNIPKNTDKTDPSIDYEAQEEAKYTAEGYKKLESGVYLKQVEGISSAGKYVGYLMLCSDPTRVKLVDTPKQFNVGRQVSQMLADYGAIAGINGGGFVDGAEYMGNGGTPYGVIIEDGKVVCGSYGRMICVTEDGAMLLKNGSTDWALENKVVSAVSAEYLLIVDGQGMIKSGDGGWGIAPRTALGQRETGEIIFLAIDGRQTGYSIGAAVVDLQNILLDEGCVNAAMMDGGSSTVMEYATYSESGECSVELINKPNLGHDLESQRYINNAWVIMPKSDKTETATEATGATDASGASNATGGSTGQR